MIVFAIADGNIRVRQPSGDQFEFAVTARAATPTLRLRQPPTWLGGMAPADAELRIYLARATAQRIARESGLI